MSMGVLLCQMKFTIVAHARDSSLLIQKIFHAKSVGKEPLADLLIKKVNQMLFESGNK